MCLSLNSLFKQKQKSKKRLREKYLPSPPSGQQNAKPPLWSFRSKRIHLSLQCLTATPAAPTSVTSGFEWEDKLSKLTLDISVLYQS